MSEGNTIAAELEDAIKLMQRGYYLWFCIYIVLGSLSVALPAFAAIAPDVYFAKILAGSGAVAAAMFTFIKPYEYATGYDIALQSAWKAQLAHKAGLIDDKQVVGELHRSIDLTIFRYGPAAGTVTPTAGTVVGQPSAS